MNRRDLFAITIALVIVSSPAVEAQPSPLEFKGAMNVAAFMACLAWTRNQEPIRQTAPELGLSPVQPHSSDSGDRWQLAFDAGHITAIQHNDGSYACTVQVYGAPAAAVEQHVEHMLTRGLPEWLRFEKIEVDAKSLVDTTYRQRADKAISAILTVNRRAEPSSPEQLTALLTFFHGRE